MLTVDTFLSCLSRGEIVVGQSFHVFTGSPLRIILSILKVIAWDANGGQQTNMFKASTLLLGSLTPIAGS